MKKRILFLFVAMVLAIPSLTFARGFSGGSHSFSSHTTVSHSSYSSHSSYTSRPTVNLSKSHTTTVHSTHYSTGYRSPSYHASSYHSHVTVNHYHVGYSPYSWGGYYHGFTHAMILSSFMHPWGGTYYVGHQYTSYGPSPLAWIGDIFGVIILIVLLVFAYKLFRRAL